MQSENWNVLYYYHTFYFLRLENKYICFGLWSPNVVVIIIIVIIIIFIIIVIMAQYSTRYIDKISSANINIINVHGINLFQIILCKRNYIEKRERETLTHPCLFSIE